MQPVGEDGNRHTRTRRRWCQQPFKSEVVRRHCHFLTPSRVVASYRIKAQTHGLPAGVVTEIEALPERNVEAIDGAWQQSLGAKFRIEGPFSSVLPAPLDGPKPEIA